MRKLRLKDGKYLTKAVFLQELEILPWAFCTPKANFLFITPAFSKMTLKNVSSLERWGVVCVNVHQVTEQSPHSSPCPSPSYSAAFPRCRVGGVMQCAVFYLSLLLSRSEMHSWFIMLCVSTGHWFLWLNSISLYGCTWNTSRLFLVFGDCE